MAIDEVVDVIAVWHRFVAATGAVNVIRGVTAALVARRAGVRVGRRHFESMLLDLTVAADVVQMPVVQIVNVVAVLDAGVLTVGAVLMVVIGVNCHDHIPCHKGWSDPAPFHRVHDPVGHQA